MIDSIHQKVNYRNRIKAIYLNKMKGQTIINYILLHGVNLGTSEPKVSHQTQYCARNSSG